MDNLDSSSGQNRQLTVKELEAIYERHDGTLLENFMPYGVKVEDSRTYEVPEEPIVVPQYQKDTRGDVNTLLIPGPKEPIIKQKDNDLPPGTHHIRGTGAKSL